MSGEKDIGSQKSLASVKKRWGNRNCPSIKNPISYENPIRELQMAFPKIVLIDNCFYFMVLVVILKWKAIP
jgi:hypothetical protein